MRSPEHDRAVCTNALTRKTLRELLRRQRHSDASYQVVRQKVESETFKPMDEARYLQTIVAEDNTPLWVLPAKLSDEERAYLLEAARALGADA